MPDVDARCEDCDHDHEFGSVEGSTTDKAWDGAASRFSDAQYKMASAACDPGDEPPKTACILPHHEPSGVTNVNGVHAAAQRVSSLKGHSPATVAAAKAHLRSHYKALNEDPPDSITAAVEGGEEFANHSPFSGSHSHDHPAYGSQGGDASHSGHRHTHDNDSRHDHHGSMAVSTEPVYTWPAGMRAFIRASEDGEAFAVVTAAGEPILNVGDQLDALGARAGIADVGGEWRIASAGPNGSHSWSPPLASYAEALGALAEQLAQSDSRPVLQQTWRSDMAFEGVDTGDGRHILPGAISYRATPLPLMLQTVTEGGHMGAVLAGSIDQTGMMGQTAIGAGSFDDSDAGRQFVDIIGSRGRFGVSIDVAEADIDQEKSEAAQQAMFSAIKIMGLTGTPFPAFENAYIELANVPAQQSAPAQQLASGGVINMPSVIAFTPQTVHVSQLQLEAVRLISAAEVAALTAAAGPAVPPAAWFTDPGFKVDDGRMIRQPNGAYACPLTVTKDGRVYGHMASWNGCHTAYANECKTPPRSQTKYAAFLTGMLETAEGDLVRVGQITMGCGHASTQNLKPHQVTAHYDGGPGAVAMCDVNVGEDQFGIWFSGALRPTVKEHEIRRFSAMSVSGDWRQVWQGKGLDLLACLAGVPAPGFPIAALAAAGFAPLEASDLPDEAVYAFNEAGDPVALVAAGVVRQPAPWEIVQGNQQRQIDDLRVEVERLARIANPLRAQAAELIASAIPNGNGAHGATT